MPFENIPGVYSQVDASDAVQATSANDAVIGIVGQGVSGSTNIAYAPIGFDDVKTKYGVDSNIAKIYKTATDNGANKFIIVRADASKEVASLQITSTVTTAGNVTITLDGADTLVAVALSDTAIEVADKIRATTFSGWTLNTDAAGTDTVIFTATTSGLKEDSIFDGGSTGTTGTFTTTIQGSDTVDYQSALDTLELEEAVTLVLVDSVDPTILELVKTHCENASINRHERACFVGFDVGTDINSAKTSAENLNSRLVNIAYPNPLDKNGSEVSGFLTAAAIAGQDAAETDPSMPMTNVVINGFFGLAKKLKDSEASSLIDSGIIPLETKNGTISIVRMVTSYTKDANDTADTTWQERTTVKITNFILRDLRADLTRRFSRSKQNAKARSQVKTAVVNKLKIYESSEYIENVLDSDVTISINPLNATKNDVNFKYDVVTPMNVINLTGHLVI